MSTIKCTICEKTTNLKLCSICTLTFYCSIECQKQDWSKHKKFCKKANSDRKYSDKNSKDFNFKQMDAYEIINRIPENVKEYVLTSISYEERFVKAYVYDEVKDTGVMLTSNNISTYVPQTCIELLKTLPICKRILVIKTNIENNGERMTLTLPMCACPNCSQGFPKYNKI